MFFSESHSDDSRFSTVLWDQMRPVSQWVCGIHGVSLDEQNRRIKFHPQWLQSVWIRAEYRKTKQTKTKPKVKQLKKFIGCLHAAQALLCFASPEAAWQRRWMVWACLWGCVQGSESAEMRVPVLNLLNGKFKTFFFFSLVEVKGGKKKTQQPLEREPRVPSASLQLHLLAPTSVKINQAQQFFVFF